LGWLPSINLNAHITCAAAPPLHEPGHVGEKGKQSAWMQRRHLSIIYWRKTDLGR